ncbi:MAG: calcium-binding protein, partial [Methylococcaceae bacterium]
QDDILYGEAGNDVLNGGMGQDTLYGGDGNDILMAGAGFGSINNGQYEYLYGGAGNDFLLGSDNDDYLSGDEGDDTLEGGSGNDNLAGGAGNDALLGGLGNDTLDGGLGNDTIRGGDSDDLLYGSSGNDVIIGDDGADTLTGGLGNDNLQGGAGNDVLMEDYGRNWIDAGDGNDIIKIGAYAPTLPGEYYNRDTQADTDRTTVAGRSGQDTYVLYGYGAQTIITDFTATGSSRDVIDTSELLNRSLGYSGGNPYFIDSLSNGSSAVSDYTSETPLNYLRFRQEGHSTVLEWDRDGTGINFTWQTVARLLNVTVDSLTRDNLSPQFSPDGNALGLIRTGTAVADSMQGSPSNDVLTGLANDDILKGLSGHDVLDGGDGSDTIIGGDGNDTLLGGAGNDVLDAGYGSNSIDAGAGDDRILIGTEDPSARTVYLAYGIQDATTVSGGAGKDTYQLSGFGAQATLMDFSTSDLDTIDISTLLERSLNYTGGDPYGSLGYIRLRTEGTDMFLDWDRDGAASASFDWQTQLRLKTVITSANIFPLVAASTVGGGLSADKLGDSGATTQQTLNGYWGNDSLTGGNQDDYLSPGMGSDSVLAEGGDDIIDMGSYLDANDTIVGGDGDDTLIVNVPAGVVLYSSAFAHVSGIETLIIKGEGTVNFTSNPGFAIIDMSDAGHQSVTLSPGFTVASASLAILLKAGDQFLNKSNVDTTISVPAVSDLNTGTTISGGTGNDVIQVTGGSSATLTDISGIDKITVLSPLVSTPVSTTLTMANVNVLAGQTLTIDASKITDSGGEFILNGTAETSDNVNVFASDNQFTSVTPLAGAYSVTGSQGDNDIRGGEGNDLLSGDDGEDLLVGGDGDDTLQGYSGADSIDGGEGNDVFVFNATVGTGSDSMISYSGSSINMSQDSISNSFSFTQDTLRIVGSNISEFV